jgi:riboflavin kinase/FMN adenylyltransferase
MLRSMGATLGFEVVGLYLVSDGVAVFSSTRVRALLAAREVAEAARLLGRPHEVCGPVGKGDKRGRELGFPTANVAVAAELCLPADGIYAGTFVAADGVERPCAISLGRRPTFYRESGPLLLEAYVLDFDGDLYGQDAAVRFVARIRSEERFDSVEALVAQMQRDVDAVRSLLPG